MSNKPLTHKQFLVRFPTDDACLEHLMKVRFGVRLMCRCNRETTYHRVAGRRCFECAACGNQVYPTAGTPFESTRTSLRDWFYVMFKFCASRNGVSAKEVERELGVTYKTAWRMCNRIRKHMTALAAALPVTKAPRSATYGAKVTGTRASIIGSRNTFAATFTPTRLKGSGRT